MTLGGPFLFGEQNILNNAKDIRATQTAINNLTPEEQRLRLRLDNFNTPIGGNTLSEAQINQMVPLQNKLAGLQQNQLTEFGNFKDIMGGNLNLPSFGGGNNGLSSFTGNMGGNLNLPSFGGETAGGQPSTIDHRVRLRPFPSAQDKLYGGSDKGNLLSILYSSNGVIFPFTPTVNISHNANYSTIDVVHANQEYHAYKNTEALKLNISGKWSANNAREAQYALACIHFLRSCTKMHFGETESDATRGLPPPYLLLSGFGQYIFNDLPVIVNNISHDYNDNVDIVPVDWNGERLAWIPILQTITVQVTVQNTPKKMRQFNFDDYVSGKLIKNKGMI